MLHRNVSRLGTSENIQIDICSKDILAFTRPNTALCCCWVAIMRMAEQGYSKEALGGADGVSDM